MNFNEKYRVVTLDGIKGQNYNIRKLKSFVESLHEAKGNDGDVPHFYFEGPHGSGKTTAAFIIIYFTLISIKSDRIVWT